MPSLDDAFVRHQQARWLRGDACRWVRPDAARFLAPGMDVKRAYPALALKYSPNQPRVPAGNPDGGQWTDGDGGGSARPRVIIDTSNLDKTPRNDVRDEIDSLGLLGITPREREAGGVRLAGDPPGIGDNGGPPLEEPPEIPKIEPATSALRTAVLRSAATWMSLAVGLGVPIIALQDKLNETDWAKERRAEAETYRDDPRSLQELQEAVTEPRAGTEVHHIAEQTPLERLGFSRSQINALENLVRIPTLKHYDITKWYRQPNKKYGGLTPRQYLADKSYDERLRVGREALILFKVMKP